MHLDLDRYKLLQIKVVVKHCPTYHLIDEIKMQTPNLEDTVKNTQTCPAS